MVANINNGLAGSTKKDFGFFKAIPWQAPFLTKNHASTSFIAGSMQPAVRARNGYGECIEIPSSDPPCDGEGISNADTDDELRRNQGSENHAYIP